MNFKIYQILFFALIIVLSLKSCGSKSSQIGELNKAYRRDKGYFDSKYLTHFPEKIERLPVMFELSKNITRSHPGFRLKASSIPSDIDSVASKLEEIAIAKYMSTDSCLLLIDNHLNIDNWIKYDRTLRVGPKIENINLDCHQGKYPLPKFWQKEWKESDETQLCLSPDYVLYVLDAKPGVFIDKSQLPNGKYMPMHWEHGYTRGIAINAITNTIIYWFDIW